MNKINTLAILATSILTLMLVHTYFVYQKQAIIREQFQEWMSRHGRNFNDYSQYIYRYFIFKQNKQTVQNHNRMAMQGKSKYFMSLNRFADTTEQQYEENYAHFKTRDLKNANITTKCTGAINDAPNPPELVNWTEKAVSKNVTDEKKCAANWALSAVAAVQGLYSIKQQKFVKFSDQQVIDCSGDYGNEGCGGGFMDQAYWYIIDNGMASEKTYPYVGENQACKYSQSQRIAKLGRCAKVPSTIYQKLISAVIQQPVTVAVASTKFMLYQRGIFDSDCGIDIDRGMLLVGYGTEDQQRYWILKNSLGPGWGEKGYIRIKRTTEDGAGWCGIQLAASVPQNIQ